MTSPSSQTLTSETQSASLPAASLEEPAGAPGASAAAEATATAPQTEQAAASSLGGMSGAPGAKLRKRLPGAKGAGAKGAAATGARAAPAGPQAEPAYVLIVVNDDGYIEVCVRGENCKSKLVERMPYMSDEELMRKIGHGWVDLYTTAKRRHTSIVFPPLRRVEDLVGEIWEVRRRWGHFTLPTLSALVSMSRICNTSLTRLVEDLLTPPMQTVVSFERQRD